jgi:hypothetical protein
MGVFHVLRRAVRAKISVARAPFSVKRIPFSTGIPEPGQLFYSLEVIPALNVDTCAFDAFGAAAKTPQRLLECFHTIWSDKDQYAVRWEGVCEELVDFGDPDFKNCAMTFQDGLVGQTVMPFNKFYSAILDAKGISEDPTLMECYLLLYYGFLRVYRKIEYSDFYYCNQKVKEFMQALTMTSLLPKWFMYEKL